MDKINLILNMETADFDDILTLCFVGGNHPKINLRGVIITPGANDQVNLVKHVLKMLDKDIPVGVFKPNYPKNCVSDFHYKWLNKNSIQDSKYNDLGENIICQIRNSYSDIKILSGAPLGVIHKACLLNESNIINEIVIQGGFAGDNIVPPEFVLDKFKGKITCPTFNLNGAIDAALYISNGNGVNIFKKQYFVSKNVCHGVCYNQTMHEKLKLYKDKRIGLNLIYSGMEKYLEKHPNGKLFHDPLAACCLINKNVCNFVEGRLYRENGEWGFKQTDNTNQYISVSLNNNEFEKTLFQ